MNAGFLVSECKAALRLYGADDENSIWQSLNIAYQHLGGLRSWLPLRRKVTVNFTGKDSNNSMSLPSNLAGIDAIRDSKREYFASDQARSENDVTGEDATHRWFYTTAETDALAILTSISIEQSASVFTGGAWLAAYIGEYMQIGNELGTYLLTGMRTFTPRWYGPKMGGVPSDVVQIRPVGTKRFSIVDDEGAFAENTVTVYYWAYPTPLYLAYQPILLPDFKPLELLTIINVLGLKDRKESVADNYRREYRSALATMEALNPEFQSPRRPLDRYGEPMQFTRNK